ncbi:hypothetical protein BH09BAC2_BH09BAC2_06960 [soil metagenome]
MKRIQFSMFTALMVLMITTSGCQAIADIFKAGMWVGIIIVVAVVGLILWIIGKARK